MSMITVIIPLYNEEESLRELHAKLENVMAEIGTDYEYIFVDDGSVDKSLLVLRELHAQHRHVKVLSFRRNYGKSAALAVGFEAAQGDYVITIDADLQDDPDEIPALLKRIADGADLVSGWKHDRHDPLTKTLPSKVFNTVVSLASGIQLHDFNCGLKAYRREVVKTIKVYGELHRFIPVLAGWEGFRVEEHKVRHFKRKYGTSKYGGKRFLNGFFDLITVMFTTRQAMNPLHFFGTIAIILFVIGALPQLYFLIKWFLGTGLRVRPIMLAGLVLIIVSLQIASVGLVAEMISARTGSSQSYTFRERLGTGDDGAEKAHRGGQ